MLSQLFVFHKSKNFTSEGVYIWQYEMSYVANEAVT